MWPKCHRQPELVLVPEELPFLRDVAGKDVCVLGSGDNLVVFALAGMGARVTSVDLSERQLEIAAERAQTLGLDVTFINADVMNLSALADGAFDLVYTGGHVSIWVSDIWKYYAEAGRILKPGGRFVVNEYHPFRRVWLEDSEELVAHYRISTTARVEYPSDDGLTQYEYHWTVADHIQAMLDAGCTLEKIVEFGEGAEEGWLKVDLTKLPEYLLLVGRKITRPSLS